MNDDWLVCDECDQMYTTQTGLGIHRARNHENHHCVDCGWSTDNATSMNIHMAAQHGEDNGSLPTPPKFNSVEEADAWLEAQTV